MLQDELGNPKLRPFLSIRWKLFLALACLIVIIHAAFSIGFYNFEKRVFNERTQQLKSSKIQVLDRMISLANANLEQAAYNFSAHALNHSELSISQLTLIIDSYFEAVPTGDLDAVVLQGPNAEKLQQWGRHEWLNSAIIQHKSDSSTVSSGLNCQVSCRLYWVLPIKNKAKIIGFVTVYKDLLPLLNNFNRQQNMEVGLFDFLARQEKSNQLQQGFFDFTHRESGIGLLQRLPAIARDLKDGVEYSVDIFDDQYAVYFDSLSDSVDKPIKSVFIQSMTNRIKRFNQLFETIVFWGIGSLALSLLLLYIIISRISYQLPRLLAMSQAIGLEEDLFSAKNKTDGHRILDDELQQYDRQLAKISHKMDLLRQTEANNAIKLQSMVRELNQAKSFIDRMLNDQQTVILVQKLGGEIIALNQAGCNLFEIEDFNGLTYSEIFCTDLAEDDGLAALNYLYLGGETLVKAETKWRNGKGDIYVLLWLHALLSVPGTIDPVILSICVDITSQRKAEDRLEWLAFNDPSLINYNKQVFLEYLPFAISRSLERHKVLALLYCEISGFPEQSGIENLDLNPLILKDLNDRMSVCLRQYDMLTQLSDDHFVIVLEGLSDISDAEIVTDKIISSYTQAVNVDDKEYFLAITIGASYAPAHTESVPELLRNAEMAMYQAKRKSVNFCSAVIDL